MISVIDLPDVKQTSAELTVLKTMAYFDIFNYPLSEKEIKNFLASPLTDQEFRSAIQRLSGASMIFKIDQFYSLHGKGNSSIERLHGNRRATKLLSKAISIGKFLNKFPYIRSVMVSGSLSKGYADEKADIDFFIITKANRLWIARTILHLFKKVTFLVGRQNLYCMNYFIDEKALEIPDKNLYTATEIVTLLPVCGRMASDEFFRKNLWVKQFLPAYKNNSKFGVSDNSGLTKKLFEAVFNNRIGDRLDEFLYYWTTYRWQKKEYKKQRNSKGKVMNLITGKHFAKSNPEAFQERIIERFESKVQELKGQLRTLVVK